MRTLENELHGIPQPSLACQFGINSGCDFACNSLDLLDCEVASHPSQATRNHLHRHFLPATSPPSSTTTASIAIAYCVVIVVAPSNVSVCAIVVIIAIVPISPLVVIA